jgi:RNA polymerase sigma-70 factor (ECF subfamily)
MPSPPDEPELIGQAQAGDRVALGQLLMMHAEALTRRLTARMPRSLARVASVDDVLQQTFADAFRDVGNFEFRGPGSFFGWLDTIAQRRLQNMIKSDRRQKRGGDRGRFDPPPSATTSVRDLLVQVAGDEQTASMNVARDEAFAALNVAMAQLSDDYRQVLRLRYFEGLSLEETAARMDRTTASVRALIHRAKEQLRESLGSLSGWS